MKKLSKKRNTTEIFHQEFDDKLWISGNEKEIKKFKQKFVDVKNMSAFTKQLVDAVKKSGEVPNVSIGLYGFSNEEYTRVCCLLAYMPIYSNEWLKCIGESFPKLKFKFMRIRKLYSHSWFEFENEIFVDKHGKYKKQCKDSCEEEVMTIITRS